MKNAENKRTVILLVHLCLSLLFILLPWFTYHGQGTSVNDVLADFPGNPDRSSIFIQSSWIRFSLQNVLLLLLFYSVYLFVAPQFLSRKKNYLQFILAVLGAMLLCCFLIFFLHNAIDAEVGRRPMPFHHRLIESSLYLFVTAVAASLLHLFLAYNRLEQKQKEAELLFLRSQINPHFLFNSLNNIYSLAVLRSEYTSDAVLKLSGLLRFVLYESGSDQISISSELKYIDDYIALQQLRLSENVQINYRKKSSGNGKIHPMLLVPFIENAFKHGISYSEPCTIRIEIEADSKSVSLAVVNAVFKKEKEISDDHGIGLKNTLRRLELVYPGKHRISIQQTGGMHIVELKIELHEG